MRRSDGVRRFSLTGAGPALTSNAAPPAGVAVMPQALRGADTGAPRGGDAGSHLTGRPADHAATLPLSVVAEVAARAEGVVPDALGSVPVLAGRPAHEHGYAVLDVVTSGPSPERDRVLEVAVVQLDADGAVVGEWTSLLRPSVTCPDTGPHDPIDSVDAALGATPASASRSVVHGADAGLDLARLAATAGASLEELATAPTLVDVAGELVAALAGRVLVAHGASSDLAHLRSELAAVGVVCCPSSPSSARSRPAGATCPACTAAASSTAAAPPGWPWTACRPLSPTPAPPRACCSATSPAPVSAARRRRRSWPAPPPPPGPRWRCRR
ncbi:MAG: hypothetical protein PGN11_21195 [Quadrisphaera sp.]